MDSGTNWHYWKSIPDTQNLSFLKISAEKIGKDFPVYWSLWYNFVSKLKLNEYKTFKPKVCWYESLPSLGAILRSGKLLPSFQGPFIFTTSHNMEIIYFSKQRLFFLMFKYFQFIHFDY